MKILLPSQCVIRLSYQPLLTRPAEQNRAELGTCKIHATVPRRKDKFLKAQTWFSDGMFCYLGGDRW
jgi:hypothetical protein